MSILKDVFSAIEKMQTKLGKTQEDLQSIAQQMYSAYNDLPGGNDPAEDTLIFSIREHYRYMLTEKQRLQSNLDFARDLARRLIDRIEDDTISMGFQLHVVDNLPWRAVAECMGVYDIRQRCEDYLSNDEEDFLF